MAFEIDEFHYLYFWSAATNALLYWQLLRYYRAMRYPQRISKGHWAAECIRFLPRRGKWTEVSAELRHLVSGLPGHCLFFYRGLVEFLVVVEDVLEELGRDARARRDSVRQVVRDMLLEPAEHAALPTTFLERNEYEQQLMKSYEQVWPEARECRRMARLWFRWVETKGLEYP